VDSYQHLGVSQLFPFAVSFNPTTEAQNLDQDSDEVLFHQTFSFLIIGNVDLWKYDGKYREPN